MPLLVHDCLANSGSVLVAESVFEGVVSLDELSFVEEVAETK